MTRVEPHGAFGEGRLLPVLYCDYCDGTEAVEPRRYDGYNLGLQCDFCWENQEPNERGFEDAMCDAHQVRHELQDASGGWRR